MRTRSLPLTAGLLVLTAAVAAAVLLSIGVGTRGLSPGTVLDALVQAALEGGLVRDDKLNRMLGYMAAHGPRSDIEAMIAMDAAIVQDVGICRMIRQWQLNGLTVFRGDSDVADIAPFIRSSRTARGSRAPARARSR